MQEDYSLMDEAVNEICKSLIVEPWRWQDTTYTLKDKYKGTQYWKNNYREVFTRVWNGHSTEKVFSVQQGKEIQEAYLIFKQNNASVTQQAILNSFKVENKVSKQSWWKFW